MRRIEERLVDDHERAIEEWGPSTEAPSGLCYMRDLEVARWVRDENAKRRKRGDQIRFRSVEGEES